MAVVVKNRKGKNTVLLNPSEKGTKYAIELKNDIRLTNTGHCKDCSGLTDKQRAYRSGYLAAQKDNHKAFKSNNPNYKRKTSGKSVPLIAGY